MSSLIRHIKAAWYFGRVYRYVPTDQDGWTAEDAASLLGYFNSRSGLKLKQILINHCIQLAVSATQTKNDEQRDKCGFASGARGIIATIESHFFASGGEQPQTNEDQQKDAAENPETQYAA